MALGVLFNLPNWNEKEVSVATFLLSLKFKTLGDSLTEPVSRC
jgi:hypothetical protein